MPASCTVFCGGVKVCVGGVIRKGTEGLEAGSGAADGAGAAAANTPAGWATAGAVIIGPELAAGCTGAAAYAGVR